MRRIRPTELPPVSATMAEVALAAHEGRLLVIENDGRSLRRVRVLPDAVDVHVAERRESIRRGAERSTHRFRLDAGHAPGTGDSS